MKRHPLNPLYSSLYSSLRALRVRAAVPVALIGLLLMMGGPVQAAQVMRGDVNRDNSLAVDDAVSVLRHIVGIGLLDPDGIQIADVTAPVGVDVSDAVKILRRIVDLEPHLGFLEIVSGVTLLTAVVNNETVFSWPKTGKGFAQLTFTQGNKTATLSGPVEPLGDWDSFRLKKEITNEFPLGGGVFGNAYIQFAGFTANDPVTVSASVSDLVTGPFSVSVGGTSVRPVMHDYDKTMGDDSPALVTLNAPIPQQAAVGQTITVSGVTDSTQGQIRATAYYVPPTGFPAPVQLQSTKATFSGPLGAGYQPGSDFSMTFKVTAEGIWNIEINRYDGLATINQPIYVGPVLPLLPGPLDTYQVPEPGEPVTPDLYDRFLATLNADRQRYGLAPVALDPKLQKAAQDYANDMVARSFFGHTGVNGDSTLGARVAAAGVLATTRVSENLAEHTTPEAMEAGLMASAGHRAAILTAHWKHVGLGIARRPNGSLVGVQVFGSPIGAYEYRVDYFDGILLDQPLPSNLVAGRDYTISGRAVKPAVTVLIFLFSRTDPNALPLVFGPVPVGADGLFSIPMQFTPAQADEYDLGIQRDQNEVNTAIVAVTATPITF